jgi:serine protease Do
MSVSRLRLTSSTALVLALAVAGSGLSRAAPPAPPSAPSAVTPAASTAPAAATAPVAPIFPHAGPSSFADLAAKLLPAVVNVSSSSHMEARANSGPGSGPEVPLFPPGSPFEQFFKDFMDRNHPGGHGGQGQGQGQGQAPTPAPDRKTQSLGSGFIIDPAGLVVTNNHVIEGADEITVTLQDNTILKATVVGRDRDRRYRAVEGHS